MKHTATIHKVCKSIIASKNGRLLDLGGGSGRHLRVFEVYREGQIVILDENFELLRKCGKNASGVCFKIAKNQFLPFKANSFDIVVMTAVSSYLDNETLKCVSQDIRRVLVEGGVLVLSDFLFDQDNLGRYSDVFPDYGVVNIDHLVIYHRSVNFLNSFLKGMACDFFIQHCCSTWSGKTHKYFEFVFRLNLNQ